MAGKEHDVMPELPCSRGKVDGMQSHDMFQVQATLLLPLWVKAAGGQPIRALFEARREMLLKAV